MELPCLAGVLFSSSISGVTVLPGKMPIPWFILRCYLTLFFHPWKHHSWSEI